MSSILSSNSWGGGWVAVASSERPVKNQPPYASALRSLGKTAALEIKQRFAIFHENFVQRQVVWKYLKFQGFQDVEPLQSPTSCHGMFVSIDL